MITQYEPALIEQNPHWDGTAYDHHFLRQHEVKCIKHLNLKEIQVITGIRRCGKSTLLQTLINALMEQKVPPQSILYINFDDPHYTSTWADAKQLYDIVTAAETITQQPVQYLFLDEIQNVEAWEKYVKSVYDAGKFKKIIVTGSNSKLLNSDYATLLSGRYIKTHIYPLAFHELLQQKQITSLRQLIKQKSIALTQVNTLLQYGGFPRIHCIDENDTRIELLKSYYETIVLKDCIANHNIRNTHTLMQLAHYLMTNAATTYSYNSLSKAMHSNENTVQQFIQIFQNAYFVDEVKAFSYSIRTQMRSHKKIYCLDNGLITATAFQFSSNSGKFFENLIYSELKKRGHAEIYFFNDQYECDFVIHDSHHTEVIQACYQLTAENRAREIAGIHTAMKKLSLKRGVIITYDHEEKITDGVFAVPFWKYFSMLQ